MGYASTKSDHSPAVIDLDAFGGNNSPLAEALNNLMGEHRELQETVAHLRKRLEPIILDAGEVTVSNGAMSQESAPRHSAVVGFIQDETLVVRSIMRQVVTLLNTIEV